MHRLKDMRYFRKNTLGQRLRYNNAEFVKMKRKQQRQLRRSCQLIRKRMKTV